MVVSVQPVLSPEPGRRPLPVGPVEFVIIVSMVMAMAAVGIDMMLPAFDEMRVAFDLGENSNTVARVVTFYFLGMSVAPLFFGAIADRWGRRPTLRLAAAVYIVGAIGAAAAPSFNVLLAARFVWGFGAAGSRVIAMAVIRDLFEGEQMARVMSFVMGVFVLVPVIAPTVGAAVIAIAPWRWVFWVGAVFGLLASVWAQRLGETLDPDNVRPLKWSTVSSTAAAMARIKSVAMAVVASVALMAVMSTYLASSELIISDILGQGDRFPLIFGAVAVALGVASFVNGLLLRRFGLRRILRATTFWYVGTAVGGLVVALAADGRPSFSIYIVMVGATMASQMVLLPNLTSVAMAPMGAAAGTAAALLATISTAIGSLLGAVVDSQVSSTVTPLSVAMVVTGVVLNLVMPPLGRDLPDR